MCGALMKETGDGFGFLSGLRSNSESRRLRRLKKRNIIDSSSQIGSASKNDKTERGPEEEGSFEFIHVFFLI
jgi:hypothetical protein